MILNYTEKKLSSAFLPNAKLESEFLFFELKPLMVCWCKGSPFMHQQLKTFVGLGERLVWRWPISPENLTGTPAPAPARDKTVDDGSICRGKKRYLRNNKIIGKWNQKRGHHIIIIFFIYFYFFNICCFYFHLPYKERIQYVYFLLSCRLISVSPSTNLC